jgi:hypothetical protein
MALQPLVRPVGVQFLLPGWDKSIRGRLEEASRFGSGARVMSEMGVRACVLDALKLHGITPNVRSASVERAVEASSVSKPFVPFMDRLTPAQMRKFRAGMARLRRQFEKRRSADSVQADMGQGGTDGH